MFYLNCFFLYSIFGFLLETGMAKLTKNHFESGILFGPWTPIYGIGCVLILIISHYLFMNLHMPRWIETIVMFFVVAIILSVIEWLGGMLIEKAFGITFWDYSSHKFHFGPYISLEMAGLWGILSVLFVYLVHPLFKSFISKIPILIPIFLGILFILDVIVTTVVKVRSMY